MRTFTVILATILCGNGLLMLAAPEYWYYFVPTVPYTGAFNPHFVRDIGCAYLVAGGGFVWLLRNPAARPAAMAGALFLLLHALIHVWDGFAGRQSIEHLIEDIPGVFILPGLALYLAWPRPKYGAA